MILHTCAEVMSLAENLENESAKLYEGLAQKSAGGKATLLAFAEENRKYVTQIKRAYYGVITDAIEGCYAFNLEASKYQLDVKSALGAPYADALKKALAMENTIIDFYVTAAEQGKSLMADVPRSFSLVARKRNSRLEALKTLMASGS